MRDQLSLQVLIQEKSQQTSTHYFILLPWFLQCCVFFLPETLLWCLLHLMETEHAIQETERNLNSFTHPLIYSCMPKISIHSHVCPFFNFCMLDFLSEPTVKPASEESCFTSLIDPCSVVVAGLMSHGH